ncbi:sugar ABC transporter permease [Carboxydochorda subterranea]|uniref:Sugar ABC transporter permease n=1 Tax=Carboxydichorda subterranea TaxID=3109565 RepID=A0ABZ1BVD5_9FIRM|nr:sugar ABC transporter permease [Limnochorda sp. L945t]WRP16575.1 sugar ABC transporter permease [Limnochorda sp. L945t]
MAAVGSRRRQAFIGWAFILPVAGVFATFSVYPTLYSLYMSFFKWRLLGGADGWVGLSNYIRALQDGVFLASLKNVFYYALSVPGRLAVGLVLALLLNRAFHGRNFWRTVYFMPYVTSWVVAATVWKWLYQPDGLINVLLGFFGIGPFLWLGDARLAMPSIILMSIWKTAGFDMVVYLAALASIPREYYEAASIDGASAWSTFRHITLPLLAPTTLFLLVVGVISAMQLFTQPFIMTGGGPGRATIAPVQYIYENAFKYYDMGYAAALGYVLFTIILALTLVQMRVLRPSR